jgi:hypothetical protein
MQHAVDLKRSANHRANVNFWEWELGSNPQPLAA